MRKIVHSGDGGDVVASMVIARHLGGAEYALTQGPHPQRPFRAIAEMLLPLLRSQKYVHGANWEDNPIGGTHELIHWRKQFYKPTQPLFISQAKSLNIHGMDEFPWLEVEPNKRGAGRIIITRTQRYNNPKFPWRTVINKFKSRLLFVGTDQERQNLERISGTRIEHFKIKDFLEMAQLIAGSDLLISNQTCAYWLAAGMGHPLIQETETTRKIHDAMVARPNAVYCEDGQLPQMMPKKVSWEYVLDFQI